MSSSLPLVAETPRDNGRVIPRPTPAKVTVPDKHPSDRLSGVVMESVKRAYGKQGAAAAQLGKDEGNFSRDLKAGRITIGQLDDLGSDFLAALGAELTSQFGALSSPADHTRRAIREIRARLDEIEQFLELVA